MLELFNWIFLLLEDGEVTGMVLGFLGSTERWIICGFMAEGAWKKMGIEME